MDKTASIIILITISVYYYYYPLNVYKPKQAHFTMMLVRFPATANCLTTPLQTEWYWSTGMWRQHSNKLHILPLAEFEQDPSLISSVRSLTVNILPSSFKDAVTWRGVFLYRKMATVQRSALSWQLHCAANKTGRSAVHLLPT